MKHIVAFFYVGLAIVLAAKKNGEPIKVIHPSDQEQQQNPDVPQPLNGGSKGGKGKKDNDGILDDDEFDAYSNFVSKHKKGKSCGANGTAECKKRKGNFAKNFKKLKEYQKKATFEVNVNPTMDWSDEELKGRLMSKEAAAQFWSGKKNQGGRVIEKSRRKRSIPASFDWRTTGAVNDIKNQQSCGDCWAFASVASIEIIDNLVNCRTSNTTRVTYSEQQITDCTYASQQRDGCQGGGGPDALKYVIQNGITTSAAVPFTSGASGKGGACPSTINPKKMPIRDWMDLTNDVPGMMNFVATTAPIIVGMMVCNDFQLVYKSGVYDGSTNDNVNCGAHALTIIGYGTDTSGKDFWLFRNSWGTSWGMGGYGQILRGKNTLQVETMGVSGPLPTVAAKQCTTKTANNPYSACTCSAVSTATPTAPYATQSKPGESGCIPSTYAPTCSGFANNQYLTITLYDDTGKVIETYNGCALWGFKNATCETSAAAGTTVNYPLYKGSRVAYHVCKSVDNYVCSPPVPANPVTTTTTKPTTSAPKCTCTAVSTSTPTSPYATQPKAGVSGCTPSVYSPTCPGFASNQYLTITLYDDTGKVIETYNGCGLWGLRNASCATSAAAGTTINYPLYQGSRFAYHVCQAVPNTVCSLS
ncbi:unnamed protein product, partial [Mesorhabditis belari]|uniref:Peptidase C1A papain C-terminal domain-containing protein n=1 Tax=Mesorhabditis belari TaxID=2138241 RepID=A0AAF3EC16_9BILA